MGHASDGSARASVSEIVLDLLSRRQLQSPLTTDQNLRELGMKSLDFVNLMLAIEEAFDIEIPQNQLTLENFQSIATIERLVAEIVTKTAPTGIR